MSYIHISNILIFQMPRELIYMKKIQEKHPAILLRASN
jgi:hypothetical protein